MAIDFPSLLAQTLVLDDVRNVVISGLGLFGSWAIAFVKRRRRCLHLGPERARQVFRRKARRLVIKAYLAGRHPCLWFRLAYRFENSSIQDILLKVMELRDAADPAFSQPLPKSTFDSRCGDKDEAYLSSDEALDRESQVLDRFAGQIPDSHSHLRNLLADSSRELAKSVQVVYLRLASLHPGVAFDDTQHSSVEAKNILLKGLESLAQQQKRLSDESREETRSLVQGLHTRITDEMSAGAWRTPPSSTEPSKLSPLSQMPNWLRIVLAILAFLVVVGLHITQICMLK